MNAVFAATWGATRPTDGLLDKRLSQISKRRASAAEIDRVVQTYKSGFAGWNVAHFH